MNNININIELSQNFIDFSHEANCQRAFADARDGLKPGQRACLWEMYFKGYNSSKPHVKSAKISGGTVASWWPHGTTAIYDTFARMSQPWINNIPEVNYYDTFTAVAYVTIDGKNYDICKARTVSVYSLAEIYAESLSGVEQKACEFIVDTYAK